jgi:hypothetical protein
MPNIAEHLSGETNIRRLRPEQPLRGFSAEHDRRQWLTEFVGKGG